MARGCGGDATTHLFLMMMMVTMMMTKNEPEHPGHASKLEMEESAARG